MKRIAVAGGGLGGLAAGALLARAGHQVTIYEAKTLGGMAASEDHGGFRWNWGGHALYRKGAGVPVLRELGVRPRGFVVKGAPFMEVGYGGEILPAPFSDRTALSPLLDRADRMDLVRALSAVPLDARGARRAALDHVPLSAWLDDHVSRPRARELVLALVRLASFTHDPDRQATSAALGQLLLARYGVWYLHDGWQQLVDGLREAARDAGADVVEHARVATVEHDTGVRAVRLADGTRVAVDAAVVAAGGPRVAAGLLDGPAAEVVGSWADQAVPVRAATYEVSLAGPPPGRHVWVLGIDRPVYVNVQSHFARGVAPEGGTLVQVLRYLGPREPAGAVRPEVDAALDAALPGWRGSVIEDRYLPGLTVMHDMPAAAGFEPHRAHLFGVAYRLLGEITAAEDAVQEAFLRFQRTPEDIREPRAWLTTVVTRLCLDELRSARALRERYVGPWLPEPLLEHIDPAQPDPAERVEQLESLSTAMLVVLESLSPLERTVFVLGEVFGYEYGELAQTLERSKAAVRQLAHRAREHVRARRPRFEHDEARRRKALDRFLVAASTGDVRALAETLAEDAVLLSDGGGLAQAARVPIRGPEKIARFIVGLMGRYLTEEDRWEIALANGAPAFVVWRGDVLDTVMSFDVADGEVARIHAQRNPDKLAAVMRKLHPA